MNYPEILAFPTIMSFFSPNPTFLPRNLPECAEIRTFLTKTDLLPRNHHFLRQNLLLPRNRAFYAEISRLADTRKG